MITRALGADWQIEVDTWTTPARSGDVILLCTDGLSGFVDDAAIAETLRENESLNAAVNALVDAANATGGEDNGPPSCSASRLTRTRAPSRAGIDEADDGSATGSIPVTDDGSDRPAPGRRVGRRGIGHGHCHRPRRR